MIDMNGIGIEKWSLIGHGTWSMLIAMLRSSSDGEDSPAVQFVRSLLMDLVESDAGSITFSEGKSLAALFDRLDLAKYYSSSAPYINILNRLKVMTNSINPVCHQRPMSGTVLMRLADGREFTIRIGIEALDKSATVSIIKSSSL
jgi:hypothetical protein